MNGFLAQVLPADIWAMFLVFTRVGAMLGFLPGFGDSYVPQRVRLVLAIGITFAIEPLIAGSIGLPPQPSSAVQSFLMILAEVIVGGFFGVSSRILLGMLETGGAIIAMQTSLSSAVTYNPGAQAQETIPASLLSSLTVALIFATDLDHMLIRGMVSSYDIFPPGRMPPIADLSNSISHLVSQGFTIAVELAAPFLIIGTAFYVVLGLISRIMTQLQVFYIAMPAQLIGGLSMLSLLLVVLVSWFLEKFGTIMSDLMRVG